MNPNPNPNEPAAMPPAGWYADPLAVADLRWWSGTGWTESTHNVVEGPEQEPEPVQEPEPMQEPEPKPVRGDWEMRKPFKVMGVIILALIALAAVVGVLGAMGVIEEEKQAASAPEESGGGVTILADKSFCLADPYSAKIMVSVALRNDGASAEEIELVPVRRYSDNSTNDSVIDRMSATVEPGGAIQTFQATFGYNAEEHSLLECSLRDKNFEDTPIPVIE